MVPWAPPWLCTLCSSASSQRVQVDLASDSAPHSRVVPACGICLAGTKVWSCSSSNPQWGRVWCTRNPCICQEGLDQEFHSPWQAPNHVPWDRDHVGEEVESPCLPKISPPCSPALDPSSEVEQVVPPSALEGEEDELEEGFQAALLWLESSAFWSLAWDLASQ